MSDITAVDTSNDLEDAVGDGLDLNLIKRRSLVGATTFMARSVFLQGLGLLSNLVLVALLSVEAIGIYGFVLQIIGLLNFFSDVGLGSALIQKKANPTLQDYRNAFTIQQILAWVIVGVSAAIIASGLVAQKTGPAGNWILLALAMSFPVLAFRTMSAIMIERRLDFSKLVIPQIIEQIVFHGLLIGMVWQGFGVISYAYAIIVRSIVGATAMFMLQPWPIGLAFNRTVLKAILGFGVKFQLNDLLARIKDQLFFLSLGIILPLREFGFVHWGKLWSQYPYNLTVQNVMMISFPVFSRLQHDPAALKKAVEKMLFFIALLAFPLLIGMSVFIIPLTELVVSYRKWQPAVWTLILFSLSIGWGAVSSPLTNTLNAIGQINTTLKLMVMWTALTWVVTPLMVWWLGFNGVAIAELAISFTSVLSFYFVSKYVPINAWDSLWRQLLAAGVMAAVGVAGLSLWRLSLGWMVVGMGVTGASYAVVIALLARDRVVGELRLFLSSRRLG